MDFPQHAIKITTIGVVSSNPLCCQVDADDLDDVTAKCGVGGPC